MTEIDRQPDGSATPHQETAAERWNRFVDSAFYLGHNALAPHGCYTGDAAVRKPENPSDEAVKIGTIKRKDLDWVDEV